MRESTLENVLRRHGWINEHRLYEFVTVAISMCGPQKEERENDFQTCCYTLLYFKIKWKRTKMS